MKTEIDGIVFTGSDEITDVEALAYIERGRQKYGRFLKAVHAAIDGDFVDIRYDTEDAPFERIRRITGYLVGSLNKWNDAKRAEEKDRVKHNI